MTFFSIILWKKFDIRNQYHILSLIFFLLLGCNISFYTFRYKMLYHVHQYPFFLSCISFLDLIFLKCRKITLMTAKNEMLWEKGNHFKQFVACLKMLASSVVPSHSLLSHLSLKQLQSMSYCFD